MSLIHNERTKLTTTWLNGVAIASIAVGGIAPLVALVTGSLQATTLKLAFAAAGWLIVGGGLHFMARAVLGRLKE